ncbi:MAG: DUF1330 domain-containing protein [Acidimicrobiales bacterium]
MPPAAHTRREETNGCISRFDARDPCVDRYRNEYLPRVRPFLQKYGAELLVAGSDAQPAEGEPPNSTVVIRFADTEAAWGFLNDPDYQPVKEIRLSTTTRGQMVVAAESAPAG